MEYLELDFSVANMNFPVDKRLGGLSGKQCVGVSYEPKTNDFKLVGLDIELTDYAKKYIREHF
jgi:hypothetical protein